MIVFRLIGLWIVLLAVVAFAVDGTKSVAADKIITTSLIEQWLSISETSYTALQKFLETKIHPILWDPVLTTFMSAPTWICLTILGSAIYWIGRKRHTKNPYIN